MTLYFNSVLKYCEMLHLTQTIRGRKKQAVGFHPATLQWLTGCPCQICFDVEVLLAEEVFGDFIFRHASFALNCFCSEGLHRDTFTGLPMTFPLQCGGRLVSG